MTNHVVRLYAVALTLAVLFLTWAVVAAKPWATQAAEKKDPRLVALERREARLRKQSVRVNRVVKQRFARYERKLRVRKQEIAAINAANAAAAAAPSFSVSPAGFSGGSSGSSSSGSGGSSGPSAPSVSVVDLPPATSSGSS